MHLVLVRRPWAKAASGQRRFRGDANARSECERTLQLVKMRRLRSTQQQDKALAWRTVADVGEPGCGTSLLLGRRRHEDGGVGMVLALVNISRARAPYRPGTATWGGRQRDDPLNVCIECRGGPTLLQEAAGGQPTMDRMPRRSARLQVWWVCVLPPTAYSLAPLPARPGNGAGVEGSSAVSAHSRRTVRR